MDTILNLIRIAGDYVSEEVWYRVIQIVINRDDVQGYAAKTVFEVNDTGCLLLVQRSQKLVSTILAILHVTLGFLLSFNFHRLCRLQLVMRIW